jgi:hypothetical protein
MERHHEDLARVSRTSVVGPTGPVRGLGLTVAP